jgi:hypothetical protein
MHVHLDLWSPIAVGLSGILMAYNETVQRISWSTYRATASDHSTGSSDQCASAQEHRTCVFRRLAGGKTLTHGLPVAGFQEIVMLTLIVETPSQAESMILDRTQVCGALSLQANKAWDG